MGYDNAKCELRLEKNMTSRFLARSGPIQSQKQARSLKFHIKEVGLYYPQKENKGAN